MVVVKRYYEDCNIEVHSRQKRAGLQFMPGPMFEADFVLDLTTFKVLKNRYGDHNATPDQAYELLKTCLAYGEKILLLV